MIYWGQLQVSSNKHIFIVFSHINVLFSLTLLLSLCPNSHFLPFQHPSLIHPFLPCLFPPTLCELPQVKIAFPHCFSRENWLCFWLRPWPCHLLQPSTHTHTHTLAGLHWELTYMICSNLNLNPFLALTPTQMSLLCQWNVYSYTYHTNTRSFLTVVQLSGLGLATSYRTQSVSIKYIGFCFLVYTLELWWSQSSLYKHTQVLLWEVNISATC